MPAQSNTPDEEQYGGMDSLYPTQALGLPSASEFVHVPDGAPVQHDQVADFRPSNYLDWVMAGSPKETFHDLPSQFFDAFKVRKRTVIVPRVIRIPAGGSGLVMQGVTDVFGVALSMDATDVAIFRDGIDLSGQPVLPISQGANYGMPGIRFFNGIYADFMAVTTLNFAPVIFTAQEFPAE